MTKNVINIGIDVGNSDTKSSRTSTPSGFTSFSKLPFGADESLFLNGLYYIPSKERFAYVKDKTKNDNCFILSLFAIAKEIIAQKKEKCHSDQELQSAIDAIKIVNLGVGLPPSHCAILSDALEKYYVNHFAGGVDFTYNGYKFRLSLGVCKVFPQDVAAIATYRVKDKDKERTIIGTYKKYCAIDIGGYTVDIVPVDGQPNPATSSSKELGVIRMYENIITKVEKEYGTVLSSTDIESVLKKEPTILTDEKDMIFKMSCDWLNNIINIVKQAGVEFSTTPVIFVGGGSLLFKSFIKANKILKKYDFIPGANANAEGFRKLIAAYVASSQNK